MKYIYFIGIDISKSFLDFTVIKNIDTLFHKKITNHAEDIGLLIKELKQQRIGGKNTLFCLEHIGNYGDVVIEKLKANKCIVWQESALQINRSFGIQRLKTDKVDSLKIAQYAQKNFEKARFYEEPRIIIQQLKALNSLKLRLQHSLFRIQVVLNEKERLNNSTSKIIKDNCSSSLYALNSDLEKTKEGMLNLVKNDERLKHIYDIVTSVPGVGPILAIELIIATNEFIYFSSPRKFACYCGIAPFEHTSGSSVKGRARTSKIANQQMKRALHFPAMSVIRVKGELKDYYDRKTKEGHPKMSVLNAVKNKIVHRIFACITSDRSFTKDFYLHRISK